VIILKKQIIGIGRTATVYDYDENKVIKVFNKNVSKKSIDTEFLIYSFLKDVSFAPKVFGIKQVNDQYGIIFEKVVGDSLLNLVIQNPENIKNYGKEMAQIHFKLHKENSSLNKTLLDKLSTVKTELVNKTDSLFILNYTNKLLKEYPKKSICHGDFHPDNIILGRKTKILDFANAYLGHPLSDVAKTKLILESPFLPSELDESTKNLLFNLKEELKKAYIQEYFSISSYSILDLDNWILPMAYIRLDDNIVSEKQWLLDIISKQIKNNRDL